MDIQNDNPLAERFRAQGLLVRQMEEGQLSSERTVGWAMTLNRQSYSVPDPWKSQNDEVEPVTMPKYLLYLPEYRHHIWYLDIRCLVKIEGQWVYSLCIL